MALPSAKRPTFVEEVQQEETFRREHEKPSSRPTLVIDKRQAFQDRMVAWYNELNLKKQSQISPFKLKRRAVQECFNLKLVYEHLPSNWIITLSESTGFVLRKPIKKQQLVLTKKVRGQRQTNADAAALHTEIIKRKESVTVDTFESESPPSWWLKRFYEDAVVPPRVLSIREEDDNRHVLYYNYNWPCIGSSGGKLTPETVARKHENLSIVKYQETSEEN